MATLRTVSLVAAALLIVAGSVAIVVLEFGSSEQRRLVSRTRDAFEVVLPPLLVVALLSLVWLEFS